jgi:predicted alpha/beta superfamily hydrolase
MMMIAAETFYFLIGSCILATVLGSIVNLEINYPDKYIIPLTDGRIFDLFLCYLPGCPANGKWNSSSTALTVYSADRTAANTYVKSLSLSNYVGTVYIAMSASQNATTGVMSVTICNPATCGPNSLGVPYQTTLLSPTGTNTVIAHPWFDIKAGQTYTMFKHFYSPQFNNYRAISVYIPPAVSQNGISRPVNIVIVNDGDLFVIESLASLGGFDRAVQNGQLPQDTLLIGIPTDSSTCDREYEMSYEACDPTVSFCTGCPGGGETLYYQFIQNYVVPAVLANISMSLGEVSMAGWSLGGLAACAAASFQPQYFQRAFCMSPSVWWNYGAFVSNVTQNAKRLGLPKSVVMYIGTEEATSGEFPSMIDPTLVTSWFTFYNQTAEAWIAAGLTSTTFMSFTYNGGHHVFSNWVDAFSVGMIAMYASYPYATQYQQVSFSKNLNILYPTTIASACSSNDDNETLQRFQNATYALIAVVGMLCIGWIIGIVLYVRGDIVLCYAGEDRNTKHEKREDIGIALKDITGSSNDTTTSKNVLHA